MDERALRAEVERLPARIAEARAEVARLQTPAAHEAEVRALRERLERAQAQRAELRALCLAAQDMKARLDDHREVELPVWKRRLAEARLGPPRGAVEPLPVAPPGQVLRRPSLMEALSWVVLLCLGLLAIFGCVVFGGAWLFS